MTCCWGFLIEKEESPLDKQCSTSNISKAKYEESTPFTDTKKRHFPQSFSLENSLFNFRPKAELIVYREKVLSERDS